MEHKITANVPLFLKAPWMAVAFYEYRKHIARYGGVDGKGNHIHPAGRPHDNPEILRYLRTAGISQTSSSYNEDTSWCSAFVNFCIQSVGIHGTRNALARSWLHWHSGHSLDHPAPGAVVVYSRGSNQIFGHVAFVWQVISPHHLIILGGNQGGHKADPKHRAGVASHISAADNFHQPLGFRWPSVFASAIDPSHVA